MESKIKAEELRIGNVISFINRDGILKTERITELLTDCVNVTNWDGKTLEYEDLKPIDISPELLEKYGFVALVKDSYIHPSLPHLTLAVYQYFDKDDNEYVQDESEGHLLCIDDLEGIFVPITAEGIKYLHQLQNLFYSLTSTELKIEI